MEISGIGRILCECAYLDSLASVGVRIVSVCPLDDFLIVSDREERHIKPPVIILYVKPLVNVSLENVKFKLDLILIARSAPR